MKRYVSAAVSIAAALALAACGGGAGGAGGSDATSGDGGGAETSAPVQRGGALTVGAAQGIPQLNPAVRTFAWEEVLFPLLWNALSRTNEEGDVEPDLAASWSASGDQRTWTFKLRSGVRFSNGRPLVAADVVKTFEYYLDDETATQEKTKIATIADMKAIGEDTVRFRLRKPNALFPEAVVWVKILDVSTLDTLGRRPVVTGPFQVKEFVPDDHVTLVRNEQYFGDPAPLDEIRIVKAPDATAGVTALRSGDLDVLWAVPPPDVAQFDGATDVKLVRPAVPSQWHNWIVDTTAPPFDDPKARQALAHAIDRQAILDASYFGQGEVAPANDALSTKNPWYGGELQEYGYDLDKARALFAEAGVEAGDTLTWWGLAGQFPEWQTSGEILQASLKQIGITLKIENSEISTWAERFYPPAAGKRFPGQIIPNLQSTPPEPAYALNYYFKASCGCNWESAEFERAYAAAVAEPDRAARKQAWETVQEILNREVPVMAPVQSTLVTAQLSDVGGTWVEGGGQLHLERAGRTG